MHSLGEQERASPYLQEKYQVFPKLEAFLISEYCTVLSLDVSFLKDINFFLTDKIVSQSEEVSSETLENPPDPFPHEKEMS